MGSSFSSNLENVINAFNKDTFIYDLLLSYGLPKASITRLQKGNSNLSKNEGEVILKKKLMFKKIETEDLHATIDIVRKDSKFLKHDPRFIVVTDYKTLLAVDIKTGETLDIKIKHIVSRIRGFAQPVRIVPGMLTTKRLLIIFSSSTE